MRKKRVEKEFYEKVCSVCGTPFIAKHGNKRICPECVEVLHGNKGRHLPRQYETPGDLEQYEAGVRSRYMERYKDTIIAIGYAERQMADSLRKAGRIKTEL